MAAALLIGAGHIQTHQDMSERHPKEQSLVMGAGFLGESTQQIEELRDGSFVPLVSFELLDTGPSR
jgi:hypothetical protein